MKTLKNLFPPEFEKLVILVVHQRHFLARILVQHLSRVESLSLSRESWVSFILTEFEVQLYYCVAVRYWQAVLLLVLQYYTVVTVVSCTVRGVVSHSDDIRLEFSIFISTCYFLHCVGPYEWIRDQGSRVFLACNLIITTTNQRVSEFDHDGVTGHGYGVSVDRISTVM